MSQHKAKTRFISWDKQRIVERLRTLQAQGKDVSTGAIQKREPPLAGAIFRYFRLHDEALKAAGIEPATVRRSRWWTQADVLAELRKRRDAGLDLSNKHISRDAPPLFGAMNRFFGSFANALRAAGIDPEQVKKPLPVIWPAPRILQSIRDYYTQWWADHPRTEPPRPRLSGVEPALASAARRQFGSTEAAIKAAGIDDPTYRTPEKWNKPRIIQFLRELHRQGTALSFKAVSSADLRIPSAAARHFGTLSAAVRAAGLTYERQPRSDRAELRHWTDEMVLHTLRELPPSGNGARHPSTFRRSHSLGTFP
jgi:hypothetical protein